MLPPYSVNTAIFTSCVEIQRINSIIIRHIGRAIVFPQCQLDQASALCSQAYIYTFRFLATCIMPFPAVVARSKASQNMASIPIVCPNTRITAKGRDAFSLDATGKNQVSFRGTMASINKYSYRSILSV